MPSNPAVVCDFPLQKRKKMGKKWGDAAAKIARAWRKEGKLKPLYVVDALGKGRELVRG
jgi:hypothetical protein